MQVPKDSNSIHEVSGIFVLPGHDVMYVCDYVKECENVGHDQNGLEITETWTQRLYVWHRSKEKAHVLPPKYKQHPNHAFVVGFVV